MGMITVTVQGMSSASKVAIAETLAMALEEMQFGKVRIEMPEDRYLRDCIKGMVREDEAVVRVVMDKSTPGKPM